MDTEEIIKRLRRPTSKTHPSPSAVSQKTMEEKQNSLRRKRPLQDLLMIAAIVAIIIAAGITFLSVMNAKNRAENVNNQIDPSQIEGLVIQSDFNPNQNVTYVQINEGLDRNVAVTNLGTTLPIISRYNYQALTPENFQLIGTAPWALTTNFSSNLEDPAMIQYLLANDNMIQAFLIRSDVAPYLEDPQNLMALVKNNRAMKEFFNDETIKAVLARPQLINTLSNSRFMSFLLISDTAKYFRKNPQEAADLISASPYLRELQANPDVAKAVRENRYLAKIADILLTPSAVQELPQEQPAPAKQKKNSKKKS